MLPPTANFFFTLAGYQTIKASGLLQITFTSFMFCVMFHIQLDEIYCQIVTM
jgi:hypothetical protein